ncbi:Arv1-domain-containing protein [Byssothecium circinans]|uniref:Protein ARV n=1 Tax=Byssothecium circinans TaxID=147558 RepID=A0A6A5U7M2_9PLEO|nr:Arv1-domain-containing protein [Byssothecium circinans]
MPICIHCRHPIPTLYTSYSKADDRALGKGVRLTQCPRCKRFADKYVEHDFVVLFIDLVLIKPEVYRHLLGNRLGGAEGDGSEGKGRGGFDVRQDLPDRRRRTMIRSDHTDEFHRGV